MLQATDLRGRVVRGDAYQGIVPAGGVRLTLVTASGKVIGRPVFTGGDGFYFVYNVGPGPYRLLYEYTSRRTGQAARGVQPVNVSGARTQDIVQIKLND